MTEARRAPRGAGGAGGRFAFIMVMAVPVAALVTMGLGIWGWLNHGFGINDALYRSLALFEINNESYTFGDGLHDLRFRIARWLGAGAVITSLVAVATLLHRQLATLFARWTRHAVVVIGGADLAPGAFEIARRRRHSALWLGAPAFATPGLLKIALEWPAGEHAHAVARHAHGADHVLVAHEDDAEALALAKAARSKAPKAQLTLLMNDARLAEEVAVTLNDPLARVLSFGSVAARALHTAHPPFLIAKAAGHRRIHALIVGFGTTGQAIFHDLIINCGASFLGAPRIVVIDPSAKALEGVLRVKAPELDQCAECLFVDGEIGGSAVRPAPAEIRAALDAGAPLTAAYICVADDSAALSTATMLQSLLRSADIDRPRTFVRLREADELPIAADAKAEGLKALTPFGDLLAVLTASDFLADAPDAVARAYHEAYRKLSDDPDHPANRPWDELDETFRQANRNAVAHIPAKLASAGIALDAARAASELPRLAPGQQLFKNDAELELLAELEHERWNAERRMNGWRALPIGAPQDRTRRLNPNLHPYAELPDGTKDFDRAFIRLTHNICAGEP